MLKAFIATLLFATIVATPLVAQLPPKESRPKFMIDDDLIIEDQISVKVLDVEDQSQSGTCWSFGVTSLFESDMMASGKEAINLSDMWVVRNIYFDKVVKYVRLHGKGNLTVGGAMHDVLEGIKRYGIVPEAAYSGLNYGLSRHDFSEIDAVVKAYADAVIATERPSAVWQRGLNMLLDNYFGARIASFEWEGKSYTPKTYAQSLGLNMDDYVSITSFMHEPYNQFIPLDLPDNWLWGRAYNIPIDELMKLMDKILEGGRSFGMAVDITEDGFSVPKGVATLDLNDELKSERWDYIQRRRQTEFDNYTTTDDHCVHIVGRAKDQNGMVYYKAKNSWGVREPYDGFFYFSRPYAELKTILILVDRNLLPSSIKKGMGMN
ncbi:MAG: C1 family peptidase [Rikenellaceae bacterium]